MLKSSESYAPMSHNGSSDASGQPSNNPPMSEPEEDPSEEHSSHREVSSRDTSDVQPPPPEVTPTRYGGPMTIRTPRKRVMPGRRFTFQVGPSQTATGEEPAIGRPVYPATGMTQAEAAQLCYLSERTQSLDRRVNTCHQDFRDMTEYMEMFYDHLTEDDGERERLRGDLRDTRRMVMMLMLLVTILIAVVAWLWARG